MDEGSDGVGGFLGVLAGVVLGAVVFGGAGVAGGTTVTVTGGGAGCWRVTVVRTGGGAVVGATATGG